MVLQNVETHVIREDEAPQLDSVQRNTVEQLLVAFVDLFSEPTGHAAVEEQKIQINAGARPCMQWPYSVSPAKKKVMDEKIDILLEKGYLEPCESEWADP